MRKSILNKELMTKVTLLENKNKNNEEYIKNLQGKIDKLDKSNRENGTSYSNKYTKVVSDISDVKTKFNEIKENWGKLNKELDGKLENKIEDYESKLQTLSTKITTESVKSNKKINSLGITFLIMLIILHNNAILFLDLIQYFNFSKI